MSIEELYKTILDRKQKLPDDSYTTTLFQKGLDRITQKVGEEAIEVVIAAKGEKTERITSELADLLYHCLVLMAEKKITPEDVLLELDKRKKMLQ